LSRNYLLVNKQRKHRVNSQTVHKLLGALTKELEIPAAEFSVVFITDSAMRTYNREYRGFDKPTDVLSFAGEDGYLGDILISTETAYNQARKSRTLSFDSNIRRLLLHGLLHLMGHDHETDHGEMRAIERRLRRRFHC
jgi:probable rRNA maturation factor